MKDKTHILWVAATLPESAGLREAWPWTVINEQLFESLHAGQKIRLLHTGIGMVNTAWVLGKYLAIHKPSFALNLGIAGSFDSALPPGSVVEIVEDVFSEMGAEDHDDWLDLQQMGFPLMQHVGKTLYNTLYNPQPCTDLPQVRGITVNTVHGRADSIEAVRQRFLPKVESMESAAFMRAMLEEQIPFAAIRSISNFVEPRDRSRWQIGKALQALTEAVAEWGIPDFQNTKPSGAL